MLVFRGTSCDSSKWYRVAYCDRNGGCFCSLYLRRRLQLQTQETRKISKWDGRCAELLQSISLNAEIKIHHTLCDNLCDVWFHFDIACARAVVLQKSKNNRLFCCLGGRMTLGMTVVGLFARFSGAYSLIQPATITFKLGIAGAFWHTVSNVWPLFFLGWLASEVRCM
jgi:hypothetical protein